MCSLVVASTLSMALALMVTAPPALAQSAAEILEKARANSREIEDLKKALNDPDQNMRLATFKAMVESGNEAYRAVAMDAGLASTDTVIRELAFKTAIMGLDRLHFTLSLDPSQPKEVQERTRAYLAQSGNEFVLEMPYRDPERGMFGTRKDLTGRIGEVSGTRVTFKYGYNSGDLALEDDDMVTGVVTISYSNRYTPMRATASIR